MRLDRILKNFQRNLPGCVAAGVVDIESDDDSTAGALLAGEDVLAIGDMFGRIRGVGDGEPHHFQEVVILSENQLHLFQRCKRHPHMVLATVCRKEVSLGVVMVKSRDMLDAVDLAM